MGMDESLTFLKNQMYPGKKKEEFSPECLIFSLYFLPSFKKGTRRILKNG
jgi:hypothetical protein